MKNKTRKRTRPSTGPEINAKRQNAKKSTGPRTEIGKAQVAVNAVKHGYYADKAAYACMIALGEDPAEFARIYSILVDSNFPRNGNQFLLLEDQAVIRWQMNRNQRGQAAMVHQAQEELVRRKAEKVKTYEEVLVATPQEEVLAHGLACLPDTKGKFERITDLLLIMVSAVKQGEYQEALDVLELIYGREKPRLAVVELHNQLRSLAERGDGEEEDPRQERKEKKWVLADLEMEGMGGHLRW